MSQEIIIFKDFNKIYAKIDFQDEYLQAEIKEEFFPDFLKDCYFEIINNISKNNLNLHLCNDNYITSCNHMCQHDYNNNSEIYVINIKINDNIYYSIEIPFKLFKKEIEKKEMIDITAPIIELHIK